MVREDQERAGAVVIAVEQRYDFDCVQSCLASIFEVPYEAAPVIWEPDSDTHRADWLFVLNQWLRERGFGLQNFHRREGDNPQRSPWHFVGYWIGGVWSPRFTEPDGSPGAHAVVMRGSDLVWDPNPRRDMGHLGFYCADVLMPLDPARFESAEMALRMICDEGQGQDGSWCAGVAMSALASLDERAAA